MFVYQLISDRLELKKDKGIYYVISWKSKGVYTFKTTALHTIFLNST